MEEQRRFKTFKLERIISMRKKNRKEGLKSIISFTIDEILVEILKAQKVRRIKISPENLIF